ncbi:unnamed protein product [[Candida] boidinii]|nr:unnamed protein product [[Candida] boidinii]
MPNGEGFIQGSIEGRVSVEYFDENKNQDSYAFKCHRISGINDENTVNNNDTVNNLDLVGPINSINFHKDFETLFTGGSDGHVCIWDYNSRKRIKQYGKLDINLSVMETDHLSLNFTQGFNINNSGILAIGYSNDGFKNIPNINDIKNSQPIVKSKRPAGSGQRPAGFEERVVECGWLWLKCNRNAKAGVLCVWTAGRPCRDSFGRCSSWQDTQSMPIQAILSAVGCLAAVFGPLAAGAQAQQWT